MTRSCFPLACPRTLLPGVVFATLGLGLGACRGCANDHPYVPPASSAVAVTQAEAGAPAASERAEDAGGGLVEPALAVPPGTTTWTAGGITLEAGGREIVLALVRDFDGDGRKDALFVVRPAAADRQAPAPTGELLFLHGGEPAAGAIALGPPLGVQPSCAPIARLEMIGPRSAFAEIGSACPRGAGSRAVIVVRMGAPGAPTAPAVAFDAVVLDPEQAPKLTVDVDAADRDKDGIDDVVLRLALEGGAAGSEAAPRLEAKLAFFDRPAGPSRDPEEPDASLRAIAAQAAARAGKPKDAASVPMLVQQMRALYRAMCLEGGAPRLTKIHGGSATPCGASRPLEDAGIAEVRALVTQGDVLRAFAAAEVAQLPPATKAAAKTGELQKVLGDAAPVASATGVRVLGAMVDPPSDHHPEWGPLAFEPGGKLLVRHGKDVVRVDPESGEAAPSEVPPWNDQVISPDGKSRWLEAYHACEGVALRATFAPTGDGDMNEVVLPIAPRLGKSCTAGRGEPAKTAPIAWTARGLEAIVAGHPVLIKHDASQATALPTPLDDASPLGSPRSQGGKAFALAIGNGVLVRGRATPSRWSLLRSSELEPYADLRRCTVNDDASRLACVRRGKVVVATLP